MMGLGQNTGLAMSDMTDGDFREITDYLELQKNRDEGMELAAEMMAGIFNALVRHGVPEQYAAVLTMAYLGTLAQKGK